METFVLALGGNALLKKGEKPTFETQTHNISRAAASMADTLAWKDTNFIITHGNGPQVGAEIMRNHYAKESVPQLPMGILTAETQALVGSMLECAVRAELRKRRISKKVCTVITHTLVDPRDSAFANPTKPVGPFYSKAELAAELKHRKFKYVQEDGKYRQVVASPTPLAVLEADAIRQLLDDDHIVICCGGGGVPVHEQDGVYTMVPGVIDKDLTTQVLANSIGADRMVILTDAECVYGNYQRRSQPLRAISARELRRSVSNYEQGTIRPKIEACLRFIEHGGRSAYIGNLFMLNEVIMGKSGTKITK